MDMFWQSIQYVSILDMHQIHIRALTEVSMSGRQIFGLGSGETRRCKINLKEKHGEI
jgi:UDP-glucose 4-epimerase